MALEAIPAAGKRERAQRLGNTTGQNQPKVQNTTTLISNYLEKSTEREGTARSTRGGHTIKPSSQP